jgi:hypothetical protein
MVLIAGGAGASHFLVEGWSTTEVVDAMKRCLCQYMMSGVYIKKDW